MEKKHNIMKRTLAGLTAALCMVGYMPALAANAEDNGGNSGYLAASRPVAGGWEVVRGSTAPENNPDAIDALDKATSNIDGIGYTPVAVLARQCVAGTNYCILCKVKTVAPLARPSYYLIYIYKDLNGNAEIIGRTTILKSHPFGIVGGYDVNDGDTSLDANEKILTAFDQAIEGLGGVDHEPIAYLGTCYIGFKMHLILCRTTVVYPDAEPEFTLITIYEEYNGGARLGETEDIDFGNIGEYNKSIHFEACKPTCTSNGNIEFWYDSFSDKYYSDEECTNEITKDEAIIKALDHDLGEPVWKWSSDYSSAHLTVKCKRCGTKVINTDAKITVKNISDPTYTKIGLLRYVATVTVNGKSYVDEKDEVLDKLPYAAPKISYEKGDGAVKLSWEDVEGVEEYGVAGYVNGKWKLLDHGTDTYCVLKNLKSGTDYKVAVVSKCSGQWITDFSNAITVTPKDTVTNFYPKFETKVINEKIGYKWETVPGADKYAVAVYLANKWQIAKMLDKNVTTWTSPKVQSGSYKTVVIAKINGTWMTKNAPVYAVTVSVE